jgi:hypothetical protein
MVVIDLTASLWHLLLLHLLLLGWRLVLKLARVRADGQIDILTAIHHSNYKIITLLSLLLSIISCVKKSTANKLTAKHSKINYPNFRKN